MDAGDGCVGARGDLDLALVAPPDADAHTRRLVAAPGDGVEQRDAVGAVARGEPRPLGQRGREGRALGHGGDLESWSGLAQADQITGPEGDRGVEAALVDVGAVAAAEIGQPPLAVRKP